MKCRRPRILRVRLQTADKAILLYSASDIEMATGAAHDAPLLQRVGPVCWTRVSLRKEVKARLLSPRFRNRHFPGCCWISPFWRDWGIICALKSSWRVGLTGQHKAKRSPAGATECAFSRAVGYSRLSYTTRGQADENQASWRTVSL